MGVLEEIAGSIAAREEQEIRREAENKEGLRVHGMLDEGARLKEYLYGPVDAAATLEYKFRAGNIDLQDFREWFRDVEEDDEECRRCVCRNECEDRIHVL